MALTESEPLLRGAAFVAVFAAMVLWEHLAPRRGPSLPRWRRWPGNLGIMLVGALAVRLVLPLALAGVAAFAQMRGIGVFNQITAPFALSVLASVLMLDLLVYLQHRVFHAVPWLWRLHRMHHSDVDVDLTTGVRFHPLEILVSAAVKGLAVLALGAPIAAVIVFEIILNATSMFNHGNVRMPGGLERCLRAIIVTPEMHRIHHSADDAEHERNFGFNLSCWDRLLGTYLRAPRESQVSMTLGLDRFREPMDSRLDRLLLQPFRGQRPGGAPPATP